MSTHPAVSLYDEADAGLTLDERCLRLVAAHRAAASAQRKRDLEARVSADIARREAHEAARRARVGTLEYRESAALRELEFAARGEPIDREEIAAHLETTPWRVSRIEAAALAKLRRLMSGDWSTKA